MKEGLTIELPANVLSRRALSFAQGHGQRLSTDQARRSAKDWIEQGVDRTVVRRALEYEHCWGNLYLPPSMFYNGGPRYLGSNVLVGDWSNDGYFEAGPARFSVPYDFLLGPDGTFGVGEVGFVPLYASVEDWIESLALEYLLRRVAAETRKFKGSEVSSLNLSAMAQFPQISGLSDRWLIDDERIVFLCRGTGSLSGSPADVFAVVYSGIPDREVSLDLPPFER